MTGNNPATQSLLMLAWRIWSAGGDSVLINDLAMRAEIEPALLDGIVLEDENGLSALNIWYWAGYVSPYGSFAEFGEVPPLRSLYFTIKGLICRQVLRSTPHARRASSDFHP